MGVISVSLPSDGSTADVADVNTPITTIVNAINGNLDNSNIAAGAGIDASKIAGGSTGMLAAWPTFTPIWTATSNPSIGNGSLLGKYTQVGKTVTFTVSIIAGSTTNFGSGEWAFSLPVTAKDTNATGSFWALRTNSAYYAGAATLSDTTKVRLYVNGQGTAVTNSAPATWANVDTIKFSITYEAA